MWHIVQAFLPAIPGHPGLIEYIDAMVIGILLMVMLWFRPQGMVPERVRRSKFLLPDFMTSGGAGGGAAVNPSGQAVPAFEAVGNEPTLVIEEENI